MSEETYRSEVVDSPYYRPPPEPIPTEPVCCIHRIWPTINPENRSFEIAACEKHSKFEVIFASFARHTDTMWVPVWTRLSHISHEVLPANGLKHWPCYYCRSLEGTINHREEFLTAIQKEIDRTVSRMEANLRLTAVVHQCKENPYLAGIDFSKRKPNNNLL